jgi:hypothetical protein
LDFFRKHRQQRVVYRLVAVVLVAGGLVVSASAAAFGVATISLNQASGLAQRQVINVTGVGLAANTYGYVLECNDTPGEPTLTVGPPFGDTLPIGCSPASLKHLVSTAPDGSLSTTFAVHESRKLGPPCGPLTVFGGCPHADSAGLAPHKDAQNYPCPPSPAQQTAGFTCSLMFLDAAHERPSIPITFVGGGPPSKTPPPPPTTTPIPPTTAPPTTTPAPPTDTPPAVTATTAPVRAVATGGGAPAPSSVSGATPAATSPGVVKASSGSLAFTGLGKNGKLIALLGAMLVLMGLVLFFIDVRKVAHWFLGL